MERGRLSSPRPPHPVQVQGLVQIDSAGSPLAPVERWKLSPLLPLAPASGTAKFVALQQKQQLHQWW